MNLPDIYFLPEWGKAYEQRDKGTAQTFEFRHNLGRAFYQFIKRPIPQELGYTDYCDIITPFGFNGPVILECRKEERNLLLKEFETAFNEFCMNHHIVAEYVRFNPWLKNHLDFEHLYDLKYNNYTVYIDLTVSDVIMEEFSAKVRRKIRNAEKSGIFIDFDYTGTSLDVFYSLYMKTIEKNNIADYDIISKEMLRDSFHLLPGKQFFINGHYENETITSSLFIQHGDYLHYHLVANDYRLYPQNSQCLVIQEACRWGQQHGKKQLHLGGAYSDDLYRFKLQFTRKGKCDFYLGRRIRNQEIYDQLVNLKIKKGGILNNNFFPLYRG